MKIKELSVFDKPYEKYKKYGLSSLTDKELLAIIIRSGTKTLSSLDIAEKILQFNDNVSLTNIISMSDDELKKIDGVGEVKCIQIKALGELANRLSKANYPVNPLFNSAKIVADYLMEDMRHLTQEELWLLSLDIKGRLLRKSVLFRGGIDCCTVSMREIFIEALASSAVRIIIAHNHPSGDPYPSEDDIQLTKRIYNIGNELNIFLWDHIIIGDNSFFSLKSNNLF